MHAEEHCDHSVTCVAQELTCCRTLLVERWSLAQPDRYIQPCLHCTEIALFLEDLQQSKSIHYDQTL